MACRDSLVAQHGRADTSPISRILNKLTVEKFALLSRQLLGLGLHSETILKGVIALIFHKAIHEPQFAELYARVGFGLPGPDLDFQLRHPVVRDPTDTRSTLIRRLPPKGM